MREKRKNILLFAVYTAMIGGLLSGYGISARAKSVSFSVSSVENEAADTHEAKKVGIQEVKGANGTDYYFYDNNGKMQCNVLKTVTTGQSNKIYYFDQSGRAIKNQWKTVNGNKYFFKEDGTAANGSYQIKNIYYLFTEKGVLYAPSQKSFLNYKGDKYLSNKKGQALKGWQTVNKKLYYLSAEGKVQKNKKVNKIPLNKNGNVNLKNKWKLIKGKKYYFKNNSSVAVGSCKINDTYYVFNNNGQLFTPSVTAFKTLNGRDFLVNSQGKAVDGWNLIGDSLYYTSKKGLKQTNKKVDGIQLSQNGKAKNSTNTKLKKRLMNIVDDITTKNMTKSQKLRACWNYTVKRSRFSYALKYPNLHQKEWYCKTAENMLRTKSGNCYSFACAFAALAKEIGYNPYVICGRVGGSRDHARDGYTRHAWVMINGRYYDPEAQWKPWHGGIYGLKRYPVRHKNVRKVRFEYAK